MMRRYSDRSRPPAPVVSVIVQRLGSSSGIEVSGKLDTGADATVIPERIVGELHLSPRSHAWTKGLDGTLSRPAVHYVRLQLSGFVIPIVRCVVSERENVLLGRNVLHRFVITLDRPRLQFDITEA